MPNCLNNCYLYVEDHSIETLDREDQKIIEDEIAKFDNGEECDTSLIRKAVKRTCLGGYLKDPENMPVKCRHHWELTGVLSTKERLDILEAKKAKPWKLATFTVSVVAVVASSAWAYVNYIKPSNNDLKREVYLLKSQIEQSKAEIDRRDREIAALKFQLQSEKGRGKNE